MVLGSQPSILLFWWYWQIFAGYNLTFFIIFPFVLFGGIILLAISSAITAGIFLFIINSIHTPKVGVFERSVEDKDYCFWSLRAIIKKWPIWIGRQLSIPLLEKVIIHILGANISFSCAFHDSWVDTEFVEIGRNVRIGQGSIISSFILVKNKLIIQDIRIEEDVVVGAHAVVFPGTHIKSNSVLSVNSATNVNQILEENSIYSGSPAKKVLKNKPLSKIGALRDKIFTTSQESMYDPRDLRDQVEELSVPFYKYLFSGWAISGMSFLIPGILFVIYFFFFLEPYMSRTPFIFSNMINIWNVLILSTIPLCFIFLYLFHLFFIALFTRWFYRFADKRGPKQGLFDRNLHESSKKLEYYHFRSFLLKYPIFAFIRSPFPWLIKWELRFIGSNKIGKNSVIEESFLHSHIDMGKNTYLGTFTHITNHLVDGIYGQENLTFFGSQLGDGVIFNSVSGGFPGLEMGSNSTYLSVGSTIKYDKLGESNIYSDFPARKLTKEEINERLGGLYNGED